MSFDLHVISQRRPSAGDLDAFIAATAARLEASGHLKAGCLLVRADDVAIEIDSPARIERDDVGWRSTSPVPVMASFTTRSWTR